MKRGCQIKRKFEQEAVYYLTDVVFAIHPETKESTIGEVDYIARTGQENPYLINFKDGSDGYYSAGELEKSSLTQQILYLKRELLEARNNTSFAHAEYDCLLWDSNILEDRVYGLIKQYRKGADLTMAIQLCEFALGGREVVDEVLNEVYDGRDYNFETY